MFNTTIHTHTKRKCWNQLFLTSILCLMSCLEGRINSNTSSKKTFNNKIYIFEERCWRPCEILMAILQRQNRKKIVKRKFKQWWSTIPLISTTRTNRLLPISFSKKTTSHFIFYSFSKQIYTIYIYTVYKQYKVDLKMYEDYGQSICKNI